MESELNRVIRKGLVPRLSRYLVSVILISALFEPSASSIAAMNLIPTPIASTPQLNMPLLVWHRASNHTLAWQLKDLTHALRTQPEDKSLMTSRQIVNIVINSERETNADLLCGSSQEYKHFPKNYWQ